MAGVAAGSEEGEEGALCDYPDPGTLVNSSYSYTDQQNRSKNASRVCVCVWGGVKVDKGSGAAQMAT